MTIIERKSWYDNYNFILERRRIAEKDIEDFENLEKQFQRVEKIYKNLGADYSKNNWLTQVEKDISVTNKGENSRLSQLKKEVNFGNILENAVLKQDDESINELKMYEENELYKPLIQKVIVYLYVTKVKKEPKLKAKLHYLSELIRYRFDKDRK